MDSEKRLKIAIQKSGRLADMSIQLLEKCGISLAKSRDQLLCRAQNFPLDIFLVRDDDIPAFLVNDVCQLGILGQNTMLETKLLDQALDATPHHQVQSVELGGVGWLLLENDVEFLHHHLLAYLVFFVVRHVLEFLLPFLSPILFCTRI